MKTINDFIWVPIFSIFASLVFVAANTGSAHREIKHLQQQVDSLKNNQLQIMEEINKIVEQIDSIKI